jgi:hypothetical protein
MPTGERQDILLFEVRSQLLAWALVEQCEELVLETLELPGLWVSIARRKRGA